MSSTEDQKRLDSWEACQRELRPGETPMERLALLRAFQKAGWHFSFTRDADEKVVMGAVCRRL